MHGCQCSIAGDSSVLLQISTDGQLQTKIKAIGRRIKAAKRIRLVRSFAKLATISFW